MKSRDVANIAERIEDVTFWAVELWPTADPRCFVQDHTVDEDFGDLDNMPLRTAKLFLIKEEAEAEARREEEDSESESINPTPILVRKTNAGAEALLEYRQQHDLKLATLATQLGVGLKLTHALCWGLRLPSLVMAGKVRDLAGVELGAWLVSTLSDEFPDLRRR